MQAGFVFDGKPLESQPSSEQNESEVVFAKGVSFSHSRKKLTQKSTSKHKTSPVKPESSADQGDLRGESVPFIATPTAAVHVQFPSSAMPSPAPQPSARIEHESSKQFEPEVEVKFEVGSRLSRRHSIRKPGQAAQAPKPPDPTVSDISGLFSTFGFTTPVGIGVNFKENTVPLGKPSSPPAVPQAPAPAVAPTASEPFIEPVSVSFSIGKKSHQPAAPSVFGKLFPKSHQPTASVPLPAGPAPPPVPPFVPPVQQASVPVPAPDDVKFVMGPKSRSSKKPGPHSPPKSHHQPKAPMTGTPFVFDGTPVVPPPPPPAADKSFPAASAFASAPANSQGFAFCAVPPTVDSAVPPTPPQNIEHKSPVFPAPVFPSGFGAPFGAYQPFPRAEAGVSKPTFTEPEKPPEKLAEVARVKGNEHFNAQRYAEAVASYAEALSHVPHDHLALANRAAAHLMLEQFMEAAQDAERAVELQPTLYKAISRACRGYLALGHRESAKRVGQRLPSAVSESDGAEVRELLAKIRAYEVKLADCRVRIAGTSFRDACKIAEDAILMFPEDLDGHILHARALLGLGKNDKVVAVARLKLPRDLTGLGDSYVTRHALSRQVEELFVHLVQAVWCLEGTDKALELIGKYTNTTDVAKVRDIKATIKRVEKFKATGNELFHNHLYDEALHQYSSGLDALKPFSNVKFRVTLLANKVAALMALGRYKDAIMDASSALRLDTKHVKIRLRRARCHVATNNYDQAVRDFEMALGDMKASGASPAEMAEVASELQEAKEKKAERFGPKPAEHHSSKPSASSSSRQSGYTYSGSNGGSSVPPPPPPHQGKPAAPAAHEVDAEFPNHYAVLGVVEFTATAVEIKKAYHKLALRYHPDKISLRSAESSPLDVGKAEAIFKRISAAYATLTDDTTRSQFDRELREHKAAQGLRRPQSSSGAPFAGFPGDGRNPFRGPSGRRRW